MSERAHLTQLGVPFAVSLIRLAAERRPLIRSSGYLRTASFRCTPTAWSSFDWYERSP